MTKNLSKQVKIMAFIKSLLLTDIFPNADFNTGTETFEIPLSDLTSEGLDLTEATAEDARKFVLAVLQKTLSAQSTIAIDYANAIALNEYTAGADYASGDQVLSQGVVYEANKAITTAPSTISSADWDEVDVKQPVEKFNAETSSIRFASDGSTGSQTYSLNVVYSNTFDVADEA